MEFAMGFASGVAFVVLGTLFAVLLLSNRRER